MSKYISVRLETATRQQHAGQRAHDMRGPGSVPNYVDRSRLHLNSVILLPPSPDTLADECLRRRQTRTDLKRKAKSLKSDAAVAIVGLISFSHEAQPLVTSLSIEEQDALFLQSATDIAEQYKTTLAGLVVHRDESAIHAHLTLTGYDLKGNPVSKKMTQGALSKSQEIGAKAFAELGITRGKKIGQRIKDGEPPHKYIHRTVKELQRDLPIELAAAREKVAQLEKALDEVKLPEPHRGEMIVEKRMLSQTTQTLEFYPAHGVQAGMKKAAAQRAAAEKEAAEARHRLKEQEQELQRLRQQRQRLQEILKDHPSVSSDLPRHDPADALTAPVRVRYGVLLRELDGGKTITAPPQDASPRQIAAAMYREARERGWQFINVNVNDEIARHVLAMAKEDGIEGRLHFKRQGPDFKLFQEIEKPQKTYSKRRSHDPDGGRTL